MATRFVQPAEDHEQRRPARAGCENHFKLEILADPWLSMVGARQYRDRAGGDA
jgi:hypothetical protein